MTYPELARHSEEDDFVGTSARVTFVPKTKTRLCFPSGIDGCQSLSTDSNRCVDAMNWPRRR